MTSGIYLLEAHLPRTRAGDSAEAASRASLAAEGMNAEGTPIRLLSSFFLPEDELWFCLCEAPGADQVAETGRRAELPLGRVQPAIDVEFSAGDNRPKASRRPRVKGRSS
jgi:hypothetical protein